MWDAIGDRLPSEIAMSKTWGASVEGQTHRYEEHWWWGIEDGLMHLDVPSGKWTKLALDEALLYIGVDERNNLRATEGPRKTIKTSK